MSLQQHPGLVEHLQTELTRRCQQNPGYSLRAFARFLQIESSALSKILRRRRVMTPATASKLCQRLALDPRTKEIYLQQSSEAKSTAASAYQTIPYETYQVMAQWYHFAIMELVALKSFEPNSKWIARALGI